MFNIERICENNEISHENNIISKKGAVYDIKIQTELYLNHLMTQNKSKNTIRSYSFTLKVLNEFASKYLNKEDSILILQDFRIINNFFDYISNYELNSKYGTLKERLLVLIDFLKQYKPRDVTELLNYLQIEIEKITDNKAQDMIIYAVESFHDYLDYKNIEDLTMLNDEIMIDFREYQKEIESSASIKTMMLRKASLQAFLTYIELKSKKEIKFSDTFSFYNSYKPEKSNLKREKPFNENEVRQLVEFLKNYPSTYKNYLHYNRSDSEYVANRNSLILLIMMFGGCRISEVLHIKFTDIKIKEDMFEIIVKGKGKKKRKVYVKKEVIEKQFDYVKLHKRGPYLSSTINSTPMQYDYIKAFANSLFRLQGINKSGLHVFRHHFASEFAEKNGNILLLSAILGHESVTTTEIYSNVGDHSIVNAIRRL